MLFFFDHPPWLPFFVVFIYIIRLHDKNKTPQPIAMQDFLDFLLKKKQLTEKQRLFFPHWVQRYCAFAKCLVDTPADQDLIRRFLEDLGRQVEH